MEDPLVQFKSKKSVELLELSSLSSVLLYKNFRKKFPVAKNGRNFTTLVKQKIIPDNDDCGEALVSSRDPQDCKDSCQASTFCHWLPRSYLR